RGSARVKAMLQLYRTRLELDRTLRARPFFVRAMRGHLQPEEYADFVSQLGALAVSGAGGAAGRFSALASADVGAIAAQAGTELARPGTCLAMDMFAAAARSRP